MPVSDFFWGSLPKKTSVLGCFVFVFFLHQEIQEDAAAHSEKNVLPPCHPSIVGITSSTKNAFLTKNKGQRGKTRIKLGKQNKTKQKIRPQYVPCKRMSFTSRAGVVAPVLPQADRAPVSASNLLFSHQFVVVLAIFCHLGGGCFCCHQ